MNFDHILHRADGTLVELNSQVGTFRAVTSEKLTAVRQDVSSAELTLISSEAFTVNVGDWIQAKGIRLYCMSTIDRYTCSEDNNREYQLTFYDPIYYLRQAIFYNTSENENEGVYSYSRVDNTYPSVGTFEDFVKLCCYNCNSVQGVRLFKVGTISEDIATDIRVITFSDYNCLAVLKQSCESFETTWKVRVNEDVDPDSVFIIDFGVVIEDFPVTLKVENAQGLTSIDVTASDKDVYTQFVVKGGSENLPSDYPHPNLQLDEDSGSTPPILANSMIKLPDLYSRWGKSIKELTYEDIKPSRTGTVTSISENILKFTDSDLIGAAWSPVGGTIHFVSGHLIGFTFNCKDFNSTTGEITIESTEENNGFVLPSPTDSYYRINELDKYNVAGVSLPTSYITAAKSALKDRALLGIDYWSQPRMQYAIEIDPAIITVEIVPNMGFHIEHSALGIDKVINVQQVVYDLSQDAPYDIESIIISDLKTDDSRADSTHRQVATNRNIVNGTGANNVYSAKLLSRQRILDDYAKSQNLPNWSAFMDILNSGKGLWQDEDGEWWLNVAAIKAGAIGAELINVTQLVANEVFINGVEDTAGNLVNNYLLHLTSQVATVACDSEGTVTGTLPTSTAIVYHGASADTGWSFSGELSGCTGSVNEGTGVITITGLTADDSTVTVSATKADKPMLQATFRISKVYAGVDGADGASSVIYYLTPSVDNVVKSMSGTLTPSSVTCAQYKVVGNAAPVAGDKTIKYQLSGGALTTYTEAVNIGTASYVDFFLYDGATELWRTRVPVILDASDIEYIYNSFADGDTYVAGGLVLSSFVGVLDGTDAVVAGMAGEDFVLDGETPITSPMFFAGSTTAQNANNAKFRVYQDGSMYAELGEIGGLTISASKLYLGTGNHNNADTAFYVDDDGKFSLKNKLSFDGTNLTINGGGTFTGSVSIGDILIGKDAYGSGLHGIKLNAHNYWYLNGANAKFKIGGDTANVYWDGTDLTQNGVKIGGGSMVGTSIDIPNATTPLFKVTDAGVITAKRGTIGGVNFTDTKLYLGTGTYGNSNTGFYVDTDSKFSLKDKLKFDGSDLTINGGGTFSGALSAATGSFAGSLSAATGTFSGSLSAASGTFEGLLDVGGIKIGLNAISTGIDGLYINANNYWDESGNFKAGNGTTYLLYDSATGAFTFNGKVTINSDTVFASGYSPSEIESAANNYTDGEISGLGLGDLAYLDTIGAALLDETIISGGYINTTLIDADAIIAEMAYIGGLTIGANKLYLGAGAYANSNTPFYVDSSNYFSLGSKLTFDGTNLTINGGGTFSGALSAATGSFSGSLSAATGSFSGIVEAGGIKVGLAAGGTGVDGIYIDDYNYWYDNGTFRVGDSVGNKYLSYTSGGLTITGGSITSSTFYAGSSGNSVAVSANAVSSAYAGVYITSAHGTASFGDSGSVLALQLSSSTGLSTITPDAITLKDETTGVAGVSIMDSGAIIITNGSNEVVQISSGKIYLDSMPSASGAFLSVDTAGFVHYGSGSKKIAIGSGSDTNTIYFSTA